MGPIKKNLYIVLIIILFHSLRLWADDWMLKSWKTPDGLPQDSIQALAQGKDGYIWAGTNNGLVRFDGLQFKVFNHWNTAALASDKIRFLLVDRSGKLWVGLDGGGVAGYFDGKWTHLSTGDGLSHATVTSMLEDRNGNLWIGTAHGVNRLNADGIQTFTTDNGLPGNIVQALGESPEGQVLVGTLASGIAEFSSEGFMVPPYFQQFAHHGITAIRWNGTDTSWIGSDHGLFVLRNRRITPVKVGENPIPAIRCLTISRSGDLWVGTDGNGVFRGAPGADRIDPFLEELREHFVYSFLEGRDGELWIGTFTDGLFRLTPKQVGNWLDHNPAKDRLVNTVLMERHNVCWVGTQKGGLLKVIDGTVARRFTREDGLGDNDVRALWLEREGVVWAGTASGRVVRVEHDSMVPSSDSYPKDLNAVVNVIEKDRDNVVWVGTSRGIAGVENGRFMDRLRLSERNVRVILNAGAGRLWAGTDRGLYYFHGGDFVAVENDPRLQKADITALYAQPDGTLWIGTNGDGLFVMRRDSVGHITTVNGLEDNSIFSIRRDRLERFWFSSRAGIFLIPGTDLEAVLAGKSTFVRCRCLDETNGMASRQCNGGAMPASWETPSGSFFYPTNRGVSIVDPKRVEINPNPPNVMIEQVLADNHQLSAAESIQLPDETSVIEFYFTALSFSDPSGIRFKYKLEGFDEDWNSLGPQQSRAAMYINLDPGDYRFRVMAANGDGVWNPEEAEVSLRIGASFPLIPVLLAILALAAGILVMVLRRNSHTQTVSVPQKKYSTSALTEDRAQSIQKRLLELMERDKIFLDPDLTLKKLASQLQVHPNYLSQIINESLKQSSNDFINRYRIEHVKERLLDEEDAQKTILDIALESGFYSKSVFNTAFKKFTGTTPSKFRKK